MVMGIGRSLRSRRSRSAEIMVFSEASAVGLWSCQGVPGQILIAFFAELALYGFRRVEGLIAELLRILEKDGATGLATRRARRGWIGSVERIGAASA
jgi:hypothetical protein